MRASFPPRLRAAVLPVLAALFPVGAAARPEPPQAAQAEPAQRADPPARDAPADRKPVQTVEVKGTKADYDPRRDDTASKTVLSADEIRKYGDDNIYDILKRAPGVTVSGKSIRMRGLGNGYTQIFVNGDRPPPGFSFDALTPDQIERIEIIAAGSAEFSMQAIAGTINIVLRKVTSRPQRDLRLGANHARDGSHANASGTWADKAGAVSYFLNGSVFGGANDSGALRVDRFDLPDGTPLQARLVRSSTHSRQHGVFLLPRLSWKRDEDNQLDVSAIVQASRASTRGLTLTDNLAGSFPNPDYVDDRQDTPFSQRMTRLEASWVAKLGGGKLETTASAERSRNASDMLQDAFTAQRVVHLRRDWHTLTLGGRRSWRAKFTRSLFDGHAFGAGIDTSRETRDETVDRIEQGGFIAAAAAATVETSASAVTRLAGWAQDEWSVDKQLSLYLGMRWEGARTDVAGSALADTRARHHVLSPIAQALYKFPGTSGRQLRLAYTRTYRAPDVGQLSARRVESAVNTRFAPDWGGNPDLRPELADGIDLTYAQYLPDGAMFSASASRRAMSETIRYRLELDDGGRWIQHPVNGGAALAHSLQLEFKLPGIRLGLKAGGLQLRGGYARNWSRADLPDGTSTRLDGQTPASATFGVDAGAGPLTGGASLSWQQGGWTRTSAFEYQDLQARRDLDAYLAWKPSLRYRIRFSAANLLATGYDSDRYYRDASGTSRSVSTQRGSRRFGINLEIKL